MSGSSGIPQKRSSDASATPRRRVLRWLLIALGLALVAGSATVYAGYRKLSGNIRTDATTEALLGPPSARPTVAPIAYDAENILLIGSDSRDGANSSYGDPGGGARSDTTILLHLSKDRSSGVAMSIPRDAMVHVPACTLPDGSHTRAGLFQFNWAFSFGGTACTIRTVESLTRIRIDHFMVVDFSGFKKMVNAVGGVDVCLSRPVSDPDAKLNLPAGRQTIDGTQALGFVRARESIGDGSDTQRMGRQQQFLSSLVQKARSTGVLLNPTKLYPLLDAATSSITVDPGLSKVSDLYDLATSLKDMPPDRLVLLTAPREPWTRDPNRDQFLQPQADELFTEIRNDQPIRTAPGATATAGATVGATASALPQPSGPAFEGRTANQDICSSS